MRPPKRTEPPRQAAPGTSNGIGSSGLHSTLQAGALLALDTEVSIVVAAADTMARDYALHWKDSDRLHQAHQFLIRILADLRGVEVMT